MAENKEHSKIDPEEETVLREEDKTEEEKSPREDDGEERRRESEERRQREERNAADTKRRLEEAEQQANAARKANEDRVKAEAKVLALQKKHDEDWMRKGQKPPKRTIIIHGKLYTYDPETGLILIENPTIAGGADGDVTDEARRRGRGGTPEDLLREAEAAILKLQGGERLTEDEVERLKSLGIIGKGPRPDEEEIRIRTAYGVLPVYWPQTIEGKTEKLRKILYDFETGASREQYGQLLLQEVDSVIDTLLRRDPAKLEKPDVVIGPDGQPLHVDSPDGQQIWLFSPEWVEYRKNWPEKVRREKEWAERMGKEFRARLHAHQAFLKFEVTGSLKDAIAGIKGLDDGVWNTIAHTPSIIQALQFYEELGDRFSATTSQEAKKLMRGQIQMLIAKELASGEDKQRLADLGFDAFYNENDCYTDYYTDGVRKRLRFKAEREFDENLARTIDQAFAELRINNQGDSILNGLDVDKLGLRGKAIEKTRESITEEYQKYIHAKARLEVEYQKEENRGKDEQKSNAFSNLEDKFQDSLRVAVRKQVDTMVHRALWRQYSSQYKGEPLEKIIKEQGKIVVDAFSESLDNARLYQRIRESLKGRPVMQALIDKTIEAKKIGEKQGWAQNFAERLWSATGLKANHYLLEREKVGDKTVFVYGAIEDVDTATEGAYKPQTVRFLGESPKASDYAMRRLLRMMDHLINNQEKSRCFPKLFEDIQDRMEMTDYFSWGGGLKKLLGNMDSVAARAFVKEIDFVEASQRGTPVSAKDNMYLEDVTYMREKDEQGNVLDKLTSIKRAKRHIVDFKAWAEARGTAKEKRETGEPRTQKHWTEQWQDVDFEEAGEGYLPADLWGQQSIEEPDGARTAMLGDAESYLRNPGPNSLYKLLKVFNYLDEKQWAWTKGKLFENFMEFTRTEDFKRLRPLIKYRYDDYIALSTNFAGWLDENRPPWMNKAEMNAVLRRQLGLRYTFRGAIIAGEVFFMFLSGFVQDFLKSFFKQAFSGVKV